MQRNSHFLILMSASFQQFSPHLNNNLSDFWVPEVKTWGELSPEVSLSAGRLGEVGK